MLVSVYSPQVFAVQYPEVECDKRLFDSIAQCARIRAGMTGQTGQILALLTFLVGRAKLGAQVEDFFDMDWDYTSETCTRLFYTSRVMVASFRQHGQ